MSKCSKKTEVYSRITGYFRPIDNWNDAKQQEFKDRAVFTNTDCTVVVTPVEIKDQKMEKVSA